jgi:prepilin-type processing-associated H-X9-DG protein
MKPGMAARGMSLVEAIVALAIIGAVCCLLMPAVQSAREAARQIHCRNNLKQIALALQTYEGVWNVFPPSPLDWARVGSRRERYAGAIISAHATILPYIDSSATFDAINFQAAPTNYQSLADPGINSTAGRTLISIFLCPSDSATPLGPYAPTNYRVSQGSCGSCIWLRETDGAFDHNGTRPSDFTDGLSATISLSEKPIGGAPVGQYMPMRDWILASPGSDSIGVSADEWHQFCAGLSYSENRSAVKYDAGRCWLLGLIEYTGFTTASTPNSAIPDCGDNSNDGVGLYAARSYHPGSVHVAMADGSVRQVSNRIDLRAWRAIGTRGNGESVEAGSY